jgi:transposase-like protein
VTEVKTGKQASETTAAELAAMDAQIQQLSDRARAEGLRLTGEGGLLGRLTKLVTEAALAGEMDDHLGYGSTTRPAATAGTRVTARGPRRC